MVEKNAIETRKEAEALKSALQNITNLAYPHEWKTEWLSLPLETDEGRLPYDFQIICSDLPAIKDGKDWWPPTSPDPKLWIRWEPNSGAGFWIRPRQYDPLLRDRLILLDPREIVETEVVSSINRQALVDACYFSAMSGRMVWHNPAKGGAGSPKSAHFQAMNLYWSDNDTQKFTFPCCNYEYDDTDWSLTTNVNAHLLKKGVNKNQYPIPGLVVWGPIRSVVERVWEVVWKYDEARACNVIIQPGDITVYKDMTRVFIFPRCRDVPRYWVTEEMLTKDEMRLMKNNREGEWAKWPFAGVETGLLTQVEWGPLFNEIILEKGKWGQTLLRLLLELTLDEFEQDWIDFADIVRRSSIDK
ncbi:MAG: hypothetical protein V3T17_17600 [Pseudomonadales bacterium]